MRTVIVGFDAFDPDIFEGLQQSGRLPNLTRYADNNRYRQFRISNPAQSEVSWTSIASGLNPGNHGIFDFVHRNPRTYNLSVSLLPTEKTAFGSQFVPPHNAYTLFEKAIDEGFPATSLWWPATFPARLNSPVQTIPGLGTPDVLGRLGVGTFFAPEPRRPHGDSKTQFGQLKMVGKGRYLGQLRGPTRKTRSGLRETTIDLELEYGKDDSVRLRVGDQRFPLQAGRWSPVVELTFKLGFMLSVRTLTRFLVTGSETEPALYTLPLQQHPLHAPWRYATPRGFVKKLWRTQGPFLTLGWPQDTTALEEGYLTDDQFLDLCEGIFEKRAAIFKSQLQDFREGVLGIVFDTLDRVQHMFYRDRRDVIERWYLKLDNLVGEIESILGTAGMRETRVLFVSDHGFANFSQKVHLNRWLIDNGYLNIRPSSQANDLRGVNWNKSRAYGLGLNSLYINLDGREGEGIVPLHSRGSLVENIRAELLDWRSEDGLKVVEKVWTQEEAFEGSYKSLGPDLVLGYARGYRASAETGLGGWGVQALEPNQDHWGADHCMNPDAVPGVLFTNFDLANQPKPSYREFPGLALGTDFQPRTGEPPRIDAGDEDQDIVEERLKGLGYL